LREVIKRLRKGGIYVVAPEGTRSKTEALLPGKSGAAYLAAKLDMPIIPVAITGSEDRLVASALRKFKRSKVFIQIGDEFSLGTLPTKNREAALQIYTDEIMCQIAALLPQSYRGVYTDHLRLKEILSV
jgi:1-acyl-sn-glycerol-3-phosphate acyltransferase